MTFNLNINVQFIFRKTGIEKFYNNRMLYNAFTMDITHLRYINISVHQKTELLYWKLGIFKRLL